MLELAMNSDELIGRIEHSLGRSPSSSRSQFPERPPPTIPNYQLLACIGSGSYGDVWRARGVTGALHAIKVVWRSRFDSDRPYEREFRGIVKFEPISRSHPGSINILHVGRDDASGYFYYAMELADAVAVAEGNASGEATGTKNVDYVPRTLASDLKAQKRLPVMEAVALGVQLAGAVGHLHRNGLVHRDIKPSNVIFVRGQAKLADIGLVTGVQEDRSFVGTEGYIPPEGPGSERADLYALGRLLYESATGLHRSEFPSLPADLDCWSKKEREQLIELSEVLARACAPATKDRHGNAAELAGDLNLIQSGRSVRRAYRLERQLYRARWLAAATLLLVLAAVVSNWFQRRQREFSDGLARREAGLRAEAQAARDRAESAERATQQQLHAALLEQARATVRSGEMGQRVRALDALRRAAAITNTPELRREVLAALALPDLRFERALPFDPYTTHPQLDPSFERVALSAGRGPVEIRAVADGRVLASLPASTNLPVFVKQWSADGRFLAVKRDYPDGGMRADWEVWDVTAAQRVLLLRDVIRSAFDFHPRLPRVIAESRTNGVAIWSLEDGRELNRFPQVRRSTFLTFSPEGERFAVASYQTSGTAVSVHDADRGDAPALAMSPVIPENITAVAWHPSGRWLAVPDHGSAVQWMDAQTGETGLIGRHKLNATRVTFSPDGDWLFTGGYGHEIICWDARTKRRAFDISLGNGSVQISADGRRCTMFDQTGMQLFTLETPAHREFAEDLGGLVRNAAFSPDGRWLAASGDKRPAVWDLERGGPGALGDNGSNTRLFFAPDARELFATRIAEGAPAAFRWRVTPATNAADPPVLTRLPLRQPRGFASLTLRSNVVVINATNGSQVLEPEEFNYNNSRWTPTESGITGLSPDGRWLGVYRSYGTSLHVHQLPGLERAARLPHPASISDFQFSPRGDEVAIASQRQGSRVEFWSLTNWTHTRTLTNFGRALYTPDARGLWLSRQQNAAGLYDAQTLEPLLLLPTGTVPIAVSPDGRRVAVTVDARRVQLWDLGEVRRQLRELGLDWPELR